MRSSLGRFCRRRDGLKGVQLVTVPLWGLTVGSTRLTLFATIIAVVVANAAELSPTALTGWQPGWWALPPFVFFYLRLLLTREVFQAITPVATTVLPPRG